MVYKVTKKYARGPENEVGKFKTLNEAEQCIQEKLAEDAAMRVEAIYCLYEGFDLVEAFDQSKLKDTSSTNEADTSSSQKSSGARFSPSPLNTAPRPPGMPPSSWKDEDNKK